MSMKYLLPLCIVLIAGCKSKNTYQQEVPLQVKIPERQFYSASDEDEDIYEGLSKREIDLKEKYSIILEVKPKEVTNYALYDLVDYWIGKPYKKDAFDIEKGVDCSHFIQVLYNQVYDLQIPKTALGIYKDTNNIELFTNRPLLEEGDIIFLRYSKKNPVEETAMYLQNGKIIASTPKHGFNIYNLDDEYFQKGYIFSGRRIEEVEEEEEDLEDRERVEDGIEIE